LKLRNVKNTVSYILYIFEPERFVDKTKVPILHSTLATFIVRQELPGRITLSRCVEQ
jgi:hypothetical protein